MKGRFKIRWLIYIAILLLAVGCGMASCKNTKALEVTEYEYEASTGLAIIYSLDLTHPGNEGSHISAVVGDNIDVMGWLGGVNVSNRYAFINEQSGYVDLVLNFYLNAYNQAIIQFIVANEGEITGVHSYTTTNLGNFILLHFAPGLQNIDYCQLQLSDMTYYNEELTFQKYGGDIYTTMYGVTEYTDDETQRYKYIKSWNHSNEMYVASNMSFTWDNNSLLYILNQEFGTRLVMPWSNQLRNNGYNGGYQEGYTSGLDTSYTEAYQEGYDYGYQLGQNYGYNVGYEDGHNGANAVSVVVNILSSIFGLIGAIFAIELFPGITLGIYFLVPLFFLLVGFILWIWRHN